MEWGGTRGVFVSDVASGASDERSGEVSSAYATAKRTLNELLDASPELLDTRPSVCKPNKAVAA